MEFWSGVLKVSAGHTRVVAFIMLILYMMDNRRILCLELCWRLYIGASIVHAVGLAFGGPPAVWLILGPFIDLACAYFWCKKWEEATESGP